MNKVNNEVNMNEIIQELEKYETLYSELLVEINKIKQLDKRKIDQRNLELMEKSLGFFKSEYRKYEDLYYTHTIKLTNEKSTK